MAAATAPSSSSSSSLVASKASTSRRPARKQITAHRLEQIRQAADKSNQSGVSYNIWYNKWSGGDREDHSKTKAETRCDVARDAGYTRADANHSNAVCLHFIRGACPLGSDCTFLHRLPRQLESEQTGSSVATKNQGLDVFGREKHGDYRDDMGGVGSIQRVNRTLYVGKIHEEGDDSRRVSGGAGFNSPGSAAWRDGGRTVKGGKSVGQVRREQGGRPAMEQQAMSATEKVLRRHFGEWGPIDRVRVLHGRGCAFVTYTSEASAQIAKEAMMNQSLDHDEIINVRWATDDPNPAAIKRERSRMQQEGSQRIVDSMTEEQWAIVNARQRLEDGSDSVEDSGLEDKRRRVEAPNGADDEELQALIEENERNWADMAAEGKRPPPVGASQPAETSDAPNGIFSAEAMGGLAYLQALRTKQQESSKVPASPPSTKPAKPATTGLSGLAAYGSDEEDSDAE